MKTDYPIIKKDTWNLALLYKSDNDPAIDKDRETVKAENYNFINKWKDRTDYLREPKALLEALTDYERLEKSWGTGGKEEYYFHLRSSQDENDPKLKAKENLISDFTNKIDNDIQFFSIRLSKIDPSTQKIFLDSPELKVYRHYLSRLFAAAKYILTEPEEKILNLKGDTSYSNWVRMTNSLLVKQERVIFSEAKKKEKKNFSEIISLIDSKNRRVRDSAAFALNDIFYGLADVAENEINSILENKKTDDELRGMKRPDEGRHVSDDIDTEIVDNVIRIVSGRFDIPARYYRLKARLFKQKKLAYHERNINYGDIKISYDYRESVKLVYQVFRNLDPEFGEVYKTLVENSQFDIFPRKSKHSGAFCTSRLITLPTYVLLNHANTLQDVLTIAHETGHAINAEFMKKNLNALDYGMPLSTAEVASTFMEDFVLRELILNADEKTKLALMMQKLNDDVSTIFRQIACYKFEFELHELFRKKGYLSKEEIGILFRKHMSAYMGKYVEQSKGCENWWIYWMHIRYFFYNYSYATGLLISKAMQASVHKDRKFIPKVKEFLSSGQSDSPKNIFMNLEIDISSNGFWENGIKEIEDLLIATEKMAKRLT